MDQFRMYARADRGGIYYWEDTISGRQGSLKTRNRIQATKLLQAKNETVRQPQLNRELGRVYLKAADSALATRTWQDAINSYNSRTHLREASRERPRRAFAGRHFDAIRSVVITETSTDLFLSVLEKAGNASTNHFLRRLHNYAMGLGWLPWQVVAPLMWPRHSTKRRRAVTGPEHQRIVAAESNSERRHYYELLWLTGASQSDAARLTAEQVDWQNGILVFSRKKLKADDPPCILRIGPKLAALLRELPAKGALFSSIDKTSQKDRSAEFCRRCRLLKITGISLHSYRHGWAERAEQAGMPERYAQAALGHASKAVHRAYARGALVAVPSLETYEEEARNVVPFPVHPHRTCDERTQNEAMLKLLLPVIRQALRGSEKSYADQMLHLLRDDSDQQLAGESRSCQ
jgi:integrase